ncbi:MAG: nucleotidyltransferase domain-containing protein [Thiotrichales bacterium]
MGSTGHGVGTPALETLAAFKQALVRRYGRRLKAVYLFGSRARGDALPDSDADVAVFVDGVVDPLQEQLDLVDLGYPLLLSDGILIEPWLFDANALALPLFRHDPLKSDRLLGVISKLAIRMLR